MPCLPPSSLSLVSTCAGVIDRAEIEKRGGGDEIDAIVEHAVEIAREIGLAESDENRLSVALEAQRVEGKAPRTVVVMKVEEIYFQCGRALIRSGLWDPSKQIPADSLPTPGEILASMTEGRVGGEDYDRAWPERAKASMW